MTRFLFFLTIFLQTMISNAQQPGPSPLQWKSLPPLPDEV